MLSNQAVINAFVNGKEARNRNMHTDGRKLWSYYTVIAQRIESGFIMNNTKYSVSTSKVQTWTRATLRTYKTVENVPIGAYDLCKYFKK